jgi:hypothetical protein
MSKVLVSPEQRTGQRHKLQNSSKTLLKEKERKRKSLQGKWWAPARWYRSIDFFKFNLQVVRWEKSEQFWYT